MPRTWPEAPGLVAVASSPTSSLVAAQALVGLAEERSLSSLAGG